MTNKQPMHQLEMGRESDGAQEHVDAGSKRHLHGYDRKRSHLGDPVRLILSNHVQSVY
jgi:hypothetical protein